MLHITSLEDGLELFKALGSEIRISIIKQLLANKGMNMNELAASLNITNGALTSHIKRLEDCGIISISNESTGHGNEKRCSVHFDKILIDIEPNSAYKNIYETDIKVGQYCDYHPWSSWCRSPGPGPCWGWSRWPAGTRPAWCRRTSRGFR